MLSMMVPFPEDIAVDGVLPDNEVQKLAKAHGVPAWSGVGAIYASREVAKAAKRTLKRLLGPATDRVVFINKQRVDLARKVASVLPQRVSPRVNGMDDTLAGALEIMKGRPHDVALALAYWRTWAPPYDGHPETRARGGGAGRGV